MTCPDMGRLIAFGLDQSDDPELEAHLQSCERCRADLLTIRALAGSGEAERVISEELISRIICGLPEPEALP